MIHSSKQPRYYLLLSLLGWLVLGCVVMALIDASAWPYPAKALLKITVFLSVPAVWSHRFPQWPRVSWRLPDRPLRIKLFALAIVEITGLWIALFLISPWIDTHLIEGVLRDNFAGQPLLFWGVTLYIVFINAGLEEWYFRGFAFLRLRHVLPKRWAMGGSAGLFAAYHLALMAGLFPLPLYLSLVIGLVGVGVVLCWIDEVSNSLWPSFIVHASANLAMNLVAMHWLGFL